MAYFQVTPSELRSTASTLREHNQNFKTQVGVLENAEGSLNSQWEGAAKDAFHVAFMNDKAYMDNFAAEIERYCETLEAMAAEYERAEAANIETANGRKY